MNYLFSGNSNYPPGLSDRTPGAPWNEETDMDNEEKEMDVEYSVVLRRKTSVTTTDAVRTGRDEYGNEEWDYSGVNLENEYLGEHCSPWELIDYLRGVLVDYIERCPGHRDVRELKYILAECDGWTEECEEVELT